MAESKIYCGSGKERVFQNGGSVIGVSLCFEDIFPNVQLNGVLPPYITSHSNGKHYFKINVGAKQNVDNYGNTHSASVDTWTKENSNQGQQQAPAPPAPNFNNNQQQMQQQVQQQQQMPQNNLSPAPAPPQTQQQTGDANVPF